MAIKRKRKPCVGCGGEKHPRSPKYCPDCSPSCELHIVTDQNCKICVRRLQRRSQRMRAYGLTMQEVIKLGRIKACEVCGSSRRLCVDHDHETGEVRGVLCDGCNKALGHARESVATLAGLITYLEERS